MIDRRLILCCLFLFSINSSELSAAKPPNIVWIVAENVKLDFECYGAKNVRTPNVDSLAAEGTLYTHVFSTSPVRAPSRSCFMVGMYQTTTDMHNMRSHRDDDYLLPPGVRPVTHHLRDAGYATANIVKIGDKVVGTGKLDLNFVNEGPLYNTESWEKLVKKEPFFAMINTPEVEYDIYDRETHKHDRVVWVGEEWHPKVATPENVTPPPYYPDHPLVRQEWARYLNSVSGIDVRVGWIIEQLKKDGVWDDTVVIFFGDNGRLEARGIHWCYDSGIHVPMIIRWPKNHAAPPQIKPGAVNHDVISLLDLTATTLQIAGINKPPLMQSRSVLGESAPAARRYAFSARDRVDETVMRIRSVRGKKYHYLRNDFPKMSFLSLNRYKEKCFPVKPLMREMMAAGQLSGPPADLMQPLLPREQLFDTETDPHEVNNLADSDDPKIQTVLKEMRSALDVWIVETGDRGQVLEPGSVVAPFEQEMHDWFGTPKWYGGK